MIVRPPDPAASAWRDVAENVLHGLNHALSNRLNSLASYAVLLESGEEVDQEQQHTVISEVERLEHLLKLYRLVPFAGGSATEPVRVNDAVPDALAMLQHLLDVRDVPVAVHGNADTPPLLGSSLALTQALLLMLSSVAQLVPEGSGSAGILLHYTGDADWIYLATETAVPVDSTERREIIDLSALHALVPTARIAASTITPEAAIVRISMRIPTLAATRRKQREGSGGA
jgi:hypothetical protein